jgi:hypothetical protein
MPNEETDPPVVFEVGGTLYLLDRERATCLAQWLRIKAGEFVDGYGVIAARAVADLIEDVLTDKRTAPIPLEGEAIEAVFYMLNVDQEVYVNAEKRALYNALAVAHCDLLGIPRGRDIPPPESEADA